MILDDLQKLIFQGESNTLEFKRSTAQLKSAGQALCAFLNNSGGIVLIGVNDKGKVIISLHILLMVVLICAINQQL